MSVDILLAFKGYVANTLFDKGCSFVNCTSVSIGAVVGVAKKADYVVLVMGLDQTQEKESHDRVELGLHGIQERLIRFVAAAAKKPVVLVVLSGGPIDVGFAKNNPKIGSIVWLAIQVRLEGLFCLRSYLGSIIQVRLSLKLCVCLCLCLWNGINFKIVCVFMFLNVFRVLT